MPDAYSSTCILTVLFCDAPFWKGWRPTGVRRDADELSAVCRVSLLQERRDVLVVSFTLHRMNMLKNRFAFASLSFSFFFFFSCPGLLSMLGAPCRPGTTTPTCETARAFGTGWTTVPCQRYGALVHHSPACFGCWCKASVNSLRTPVGGAPDG